MANRRMFSVRITNTARFLRMPFESQCLYFHLGLHADDDGIVEAYPVLRKIGCGEDNLKVLVAKGFVIVLTEDLVSLITDWQEHNLIRADRKVDSIYKKLLLKILPNVDLQEPRPRADTGSLPRQPKQVDADWTSTGLHRVGKGRIGEDKKMIALPAPDNTPVFDSPKKAKSNGRPDAIPPDLWDDFLTIRKAKRSPMTETAIRGLTREAEKAGITLEDAIKICVERGWQSFRASWKWQDEAEKKEESNIDKWLRKSKEGGHYDV